MNYVSHLFIIQDFKMKIQAKTTTRLLYKQTYSNFVPFLFCYLVDYTTRSQMSQTLYIPYKTNTQLISIVAWLLTTFILTRHQGYYWYTIVILMQNSLTNLYIRAPVLQCSCSQLLSCSLNYAVMGIHGFQVRLVY